MKIPRKFWAPSVTSQFKVCPIPFHFDTYRGCTYGCSSECCGTSFLRNHKIWGKNTRTITMQDNPQWYSTEFGKCYVNFTRSQTHKDKTIEEVCEEYIKNMTIPKNLTYDE